MSSEIDDGGPAFPVSPKIHPDFGSPGMSLRDFYIGCLLSNPAIITGYGSNDSVRSQCDCVLDYAQEILNGR